MGRTVWYPGHMAKGRRQLGALAGAIDLLLEVRDARAPRLTESPSIDEIGRGMKVWTVLSKSDLADEASTAEWTEALSSSGRRTWALDLRRGVPGSMSRAMAEMRPKSSAQKVYRELRVAVVGTPNVGKSTLLNRLVGRRAASVGGVPGVTRGVAWFRGDGLLIADSPGLLDPREDARAHRMLGWISSTKASVIGSWEAHACECIAYLAGRGMIGALESAWGVETSGEPRDVLCRVARRLGKLAHGGEPDLEAAGSAFISSLSTGKLGRITIERPGESSWEALS